MSNKNQQQQKDTNILSPEDLELREKVVSMELKARYWKADYEIKYFTLASQNLNDQYAQFLTSIQNGGTPQQQQPQQEGEQTEADKEYQEWLNKNEAEQKSPETIEEIVGLPTGITALENTEA